jgi:DNA-binding transcriptional LysR family regulator
MKALQDLDIFVRTVDAGSLSAAARTLDITPAAASAALQRLEAELQTVLLVRSTRSLRLTPEGAVFLEHCRLALNTLHEGQQTLATGRQQVQGTLRLAVSSTWGVTCCYPGWMPSRTCIRKYASGCRYLTGWQTSSASRWTPPFATANRPIPA